MPTAARSKTPDEDDGAGEKAAAPDPRDARIAELERQLDEARQPVSAPDASAPPVRLKVEPPHSELHYARYVIGTEYTEVPARMSSAIMEAAADAGVTLTQDMEG